MAARRGIGPHAPHPLDPGLVLRECLLEVRRVRAVDHVVGRRGASRGVDRLDRLLQGLPGGQAAIRLHRERDHHRHLGLHRGARHADRLFGVRHGEGADQVGFRLRKCLNLRRVQPLGVVGAHRTSDIAVAQRPDIAADRHRRIRRLQFEAHLLQQFDRRAVECIELLRRVTEFGAPVSIAAPGRAFQQEAHARIDGGPRVLAEIFEESVAAALGLQQFERGELVELDPILEDQRCLEPAVGEEKAAAKLRQVVSILRHLSSHFL